MLVVAADALAKEEKSLEELQERMRGATSELHVSLESRQRELLPHSKEAQAQKNAIALASEELGIPHEAVGECSAVGECGAVGDG